MPSQRCGCGSGAVRRGEARNRSPRRRSAARRSPRLRLRRWRRVGRGGERLRGIRVGNWVWGLDLGRDSHPGSELIHIQRDTDQHETHHQQLATLRTSQPSSSSKDEALSSQPSQSSLPLLSSPPSHTAQPIDAREEQIRAPLACVHPAASPYLARTATPPLGSADLDALRAARARSSRLGLTRPASLRVLGSPKQFLSAVPLRLFRDPAAASLVRRTGARPFGAVAFLHARDGATYLPAASLRRTAPLLYERLQPDSPRPMPSSSSCRRSLLSFLVKVRYMGSSIAGDSRLERLK
ncbi:hypothetical protein DAI22_12g133550 [Oryza sativa Japonica Group]|nr:hypothetical protein DAI22_12g133550 [Oryza sativa Japonica Group]